MKYIFTLVFTTLAYILFPCTTFVLQTSENILFGRNLDWVSDDGIIVVNKRGITKTALILPPNNPHKWTSKYGSVSFNQFGKEFPFGGINEKGLVVELMLAPASYPVPDTRAAVNELQWIQYQLDNCATIEDVIKSDSILRISKVSKELHFLICDKTGNTAVIEFKKGNMQVYKNTTLPYPVLENDVYSTSLSKHNQNVNCRFSIAALMLENYKKEKYGNPLDYSFSILENVKVNGMWSIVYDIKNLKIYFKTNSNSSLKTIDLQSFDYSCTSPVVLYFDLQSTKNGTVNSYFTPLSFTTNENKMRKAFKSNYIQLPKQIIDTFVLYYNTISCL